MSTIKNVVREVSAVEHHKNSDNLDLVLVDGWQVVVRRCSFKVGDLVVYLEPGVVVSEQFADALEVTKYLDKKTDINGDKVLVVGKIKLRGEPSFGLLIHAEDGFNLNDDIGDMYPFSKFEPPVKNTFFKGDAAPEVPAFNRYTDIENMRNYPDVFVEGEMVVVSEKVHGTNSRIGYITDNDGKLRHLAGSRRVIRKSPEEEVNQIDYYVVGTYWEPFAIEGVRQYLEACKLLGHKNIILYGEIFGCGIQKWDYDRQKHDYVCFDICVDGVFLNHNSLSTLCSAFGIPMAPVLYCGPFDIETIRRLSNGPTVVGGSGAKHGREGVVVRPYNEATNPKISRKILKYVGDDFLFNKAAQDDDSTDI
jgi:RNA ligase (TIGR02306 family)